MSHDLPAPQYSMQLQMEDRSLALLQYRRLPGWILRTIECRDIGIDGEIELHTSGRPDARLFKFQLKSRATVRWNESGSARSSPLDVRSANYWLGLQKNLGLPVFLFEADLSTEYVYFEAIGPQLRRDYDALFKQKTVSLEIQPTHHLAHPSACEVFERHFLRECSLHEFVASAEKCLFSLLDTARSLLWWQGRDGHMEVDDSVREQRICEIYQDAVSLQHHLLNHTDDLLMPRLPKFESLVSECQMAMVGSGRMLEYTMTALCEKVEEVLPLMAQAIIMRFHNEEQAYWRRERPALFEKCASLLAFVQAYAKDVQQPRRIRLTTSIVWSQEAV